AGGTSAAIFVRHPRTALSLDVAGSRRMKRPGLTLTVQQQFALFRDYVRAALQAHNCIVCCWAGDGLLALFGTPGEGAACAVAIVKDLDAFNASVTEMVEPIRVRMGVHHGEVLMSEEQPLGEVTSPILDIAGHLQKSAPEDTILISEPTYQAL